MDSASLQKYLLRLFERHDVELDEDEDGWLVTDGDFPAIRAGWHPGIVGEPEFEVRHHAGDVLEMPALAPAAGGEQQRERQQPGAARHHLLRIQ